MAPILSFTAEEAWAVLHPRRAPEPQDSVFLHTWKNVLPAQEGEKDLLEKWRRIRDVRAAVMKAIEERRAAGEVGSSLQAEVEVEVGPADAALLRSLGEDLRYVLITSKAVVRDGAEGVQVRVQASSHAKCERCWHYREDVGAARDHSTICARCVSNLSGQGERRAHA
jgi:isoleucyl-tRNA synthetase